jgi:hypothetical protein
MTVTGLIHVWLPCAAVQQYALELNSKHGGDQRYMLILWHGALGDHHVLWCRGNQQDCGYLDMMHTRMVTTDRVLQRCTVVSISAGSIGACEWACGCELTANALSEQ